MNVSICRNAISTAKVKANLRAISRVTESAKENPQQAAPKAKSQILPAAPVSRNAKTTGVRIMQLNMERSAVVVGVVRNL